MDNRRGVTQVLMVAYLAGLLCGSLGGLLIYRKLIQPDHSQSLLECEALERKLDSRVKARDPAAAAGTKSQREQLIQHTTEIITNRIIGRLPSFLPASTRNAVKQYISDTLRLDLSHFYNDVWTTISNETVLIPRDVYVQFTQRVSRHNQADPEALKWSTLLGVLLVALVIGVLSLSVYCLVPSTALLWRP